MSLSRGSAAQIAQLVLGALLAICSASSFAFSSDLAGGHDILAQVRAFALGGAEQRGRSASCPAIRA